ncbi:hypothetical protein ACLBSL_32550, partial [Klebsiella pneumoniae]|uniref:hypothetical protein n=1 Tax=Klebsiella pneumoniae TaxID=573 RepID=UPI003968B90D
SIFFLHRIAASYTHVDAVLYMDTTLLTLSLVTLVKLNSLLVLLNDVSNNLYLSIIVLLSINDFIPIFKSMSRV